RFDLYIADAGLICPRGTLQQGNGSLCSTIGQPKPCESCVAVIPDAISGADWRARWRRLAQNAERIIVPCAVGNGFAARFLDRKLTSIRTEWSRASSAKPRNPLIHQPTCGIVTVGRAANELGLILCAARTLKKSSFMVIGTTVDDLGLMASGNVFVSG